MAVFCEHCTEPFGSTKAGNFSRRGTINCQERPCTMALVVYWKFSDHLFYTSQERLHKLLTDLLNDYTEQTTWHPCTDAAVALQSFHTDTKRRLWNTKLYAKTESRLYVHKCISTTCKSEQVQLRVLSPYYSFFVVFLRTNRRGQDNCRLQTFPPLPPPLHYHPLTG
jgi:hypothetical protein